MNSISKAEWQQINTLLQSIYRSSSSDTLFNDVIDSLQSLVPHSHSLACYQLPGYTPGSPERMRSNDIPAEYLQSYRDRYSRLDYINWYVDSRFDGVFRESDVLSDSARSESIFTKEWLRPLNIFHGVCMIVADEGRQYGTMFLYRSETEGDFSDRELEILRVINTHVGLRYSLYPSIKSPYEYSDGISFGESLLTKKEFEIVHMIKDGTLKDDLCSSLFITKNTLNKHLDNIYKKLDLHTYEELLQFLHQKR